jgi:uncharacterized protein
MPDPAQLDRPMFLRQLCTDEYRPLPYSAADRLVIRRTQAALAAAADRQGAPVRALAGGRLATAIGLRALNQEYGGEFFDVPGPACVHEEAAAEALSGDELVVDVQTHYMAPHSSAIFPKEWLRDLLRSVMPPFWHDLDEQAQWDLAYYITNVFLRTETAVAVLTSSPGTTDLCPLFNDEIFATRTLMDGLAGTGRLLNHAVVHAYSADHRQQMEEMRDRYGPVGWKVYTRANHLEGGSTPPWLLTDDEVGIPFLERARDLKVPLVCVHKGLTHLAENGTPADIGPSARAFPELDFVVYHAGYELPVDGNPPEGPYTDGAADVGVNRLLRGVEAAGLGRGSNVYAELGTTWFSVVRDPVAAAHLLGKLIKTLGSDNVVWGSDSIFYGGAQPLVDAFRAFQIPEAMCEEFGYLPITAEDKEKILGLNAARLYGIDVELTRRRVAEDDLAWARAAVAEYRRQPVPGLR